MKTQHTLTAALAAFAGLSFATLYAAPNYTPNVNSPINATPLINSTSANLNTFDDFIGLIDASLAGTDSLVLPTPSGSTFPAFKAFNEAVSAAVAANPANAQQIIGAAVQFQAGNYAGKVKDILKLAITNTPAVAEEAVIGAVAGNPAKAADAAAGAILGLIASSAASSADYGDVADDTIDPTTHVLIEKIAKAAVAATKTSPTGSPSNASKVASALVEAVLADGASLYLDDVARGLTAGAKGIAGTNQGEVAAAALARLNGTAYENTKFVSEFVTGALRAMVVSGTSPSTDYTTVLNALLAETSVGTSFTAQINAVNSAHLALRNAGGGTEVSAFTGALNATNAANLEAFMIGAVQNKSSKAADFITAAFNDSDYTALAPSVASRQALIAAAVRAKGSGAGKVVTAAIKSTANAVSASDALKAAIPNTTWEYAGVATGAAIKANTVQTASVIATDALVAAVDAGYSGAINDIALQAVKAKKTEAPAIVQALVTEVKSAGWREAIVAQAVINDKNNKAAIKTHAVDALAPTANFERASLALTADIAADSKTFSKEAFDRAVADFYGTSGVFIGADLAGFQAKDFAKAILFGRGGVNIKNAGPLLAVALRANGSVSEAELLAAAKSIYKKNSTVLDLQLTVIKDVIASPDQIFDLVDHQVFTHASKLAPEIAAAAAAARPEYAHFVARAASFRAPASAGKVGAAAITYAHMKSNVDSNGVALASGSSNDPAAVAAISAATILGIKDAKLPTSPSNKELAAVKAAAAALAKAALLLESGNNVTIPTYGSPGNEQKTKGAAGVVTGLISQILGYGGTSTNASSTLLETAISAVVKAAKKDAVAIAQAAGQAAQGVYQQTGAGEISAALKQAIANAVVAGGYLGGDALAIVQFGVSEALANRYGAGAAGVRDFAHRSGTGAPVTDISNF